MIDDVDIPLEISDRIYSNFVEDYDQKLLQLKRFFRRNNATIQNLPLAERMIPIIFQEYFNLNKQILVKILEDRNYDEKISKKQIWFKEADFIEELLIRIKESFTSKSITDINILTQFDNDADRIEKYIDYIYTGTEIILNSYGKYSDIHLASVSLYWFCKLILESIYSVLSRYADLKNEYHIDINYRDILYNAYSNSESFRKFYNVESFRSLVVFDPRKREDYYNFLVDKNNYASTQFDEMMMMPDSLYTLFNTDLIYKYMIPQNVFAHLVNPRRIKIMNEFSKYSLGVN